MLDLVKIESNLRYFSNSQASSPEQKTLPFRFDNTVSLVLPTFTYQRDLMCLSLAGLPIPIITINGTNSIPNVTVKKPAMFISSRVHPGETNASYVFDGLFRFLSNFNNSTP